MNQVSMCKLEVMNIIELSVSNLNNQNVIKWKRIKDEERGGVKDVNLKQIKTE